MTWTVSGGQLVLVGASIASCSVTPATPPLLQDVTAAGDWWSGGCPGTGTPPAGMREAWSPELTERLRRRYPPGSDARTLEQALRDQHFAAPEPCADGAATRIAIFRQTGGGMFGPFPMFAVVVWRQDRAGRIVWTKGHVAFTAP